MSEIGHNQPPDMTATAGDTMRDISAWLAENPVIDEANAREAKVFVDRGKLCIQDLEAERETKVKPLNQQVQQINDYYRPPRTLLQKVLDELKNRVSAFIRIEEEKRIKAAGEARRKAEEAEQAAREAERIEREKLEDAASGELGVDVAEVTQAADKAFTASQKAQRQAAIAERDSHVKLGRGLGPAVSLREKETLIITDAAAAIKVIGTNENIEKGIRELARAYRKLHGALPSGVSATYERKI